MSSGQPHLSVTLPKNFTFHYTDAEQPRTPEPRADDNVAERPPRIARQTYRVRRRRPPLPTHTPTLFPNIGQDQPIPTIEVPDAGPISPCPLFAADPGDSEGRLLLSIPTTNTPAHGSVSPPKTPVGQVAMVQNGPADFDGDADVISLAGSISRPSSACSGISESSVSSQGSTSSYDGSCTSPESDTSDPFVFAELKPHQPPLSSPLGPYSTGQRAKRLRTRKRGVWTKSMDGHLWLTYMSCIQDPTVTPIKMVPGTVPPLGICARVARLAKKTWKGASAAGCHPTPGVADTQSGNTTLTPLDVLRSGSKWPRSEAAARARLRKLCRRQPSSLSVQYCRLLRTRSPSPLSSSQHSHTRPETAPFAWPVGPGQPAGHQSSTNPFTTRDMDVSLATCTSSTMQTGNPLHALTLDVPQSNRGDGLLLSQENGQRIAHRKSQSLHAGVGHGNPTYDDSSRSLLASPFSTMPRKSPYGTQAVTPAAQPEPMPGNSVELHAPTPVTRSFKRRAQQYLEDLQGAETTEASRNMPQKLFHTPIDSRGRGVRARGLSLGLASSRLADLFTPPPSAEQADGTAMVIEPLGQPLDAPSSPSDLATRLKSPFRGRSSNGSFNRTFPRVSSPRLLASPTSFVRIDAFER